VLDKYLTPNRGFLPAFTGNEQFWDKTERRRKLMACLPAMVGIKPSSVI
jgi:hypothetical protein